MLKNPKYAFKLKDILIKDYSVNPLAFIKETQVSLQLQFSFSNGEKATQQMALVITSPLSLAVFFRGLKFP